MTSEQTKLYDFLTAKILAYYKASPLLVAINGKDGSGKTMMADSLAEHLASRTDREIIRISIDDFMNKREVRYTPTESAGRSCYEYTFNFEGFVQNVLHPLQADSSWGYRTRIFDHATDLDDFSPVKKAARSAIVIIDGVFLYKEELLPYWDIKILLETDDEVVIERGARRDAARLGSYEVAKQKYIERYIASQTIYYQEEAPEERADIIVDNNDFRTPRILK